MRPLTIAIVVALPACAFGAGAVGWRTDGTGDYGGTNPPIVWSDDQAIVWKTATPAWSNASPAVLEDRLFVLAEPSLLLCLDRASGAVRWSASNDYDDVFDTKTIKQLKDDLERQKPDLERQLAELREKIESFEETDRRSRRQLRRLGRQEEQLKRQISGEDPFGMPQAHGDNGYASATPITDGEHVWALFGTGVVVCYDLEGRRRWARLIQKPTSGWGHSASLRMVDKKLIVPIIDLFALDPDTGKTLWRAPSEAHWGTPAVARLGDTAVVITTAGQVVRAADGQVLASDLPRMNWNGPLVLENTVYFIEKKASAYELPADSAEPFEPDPLWTTHIKDSRHYASPVVHEGLIYTISREATLSVLDAQSGELVYEKKMDLGGGGKNSVYTSLSFAGGRLFAGSLDGDFAVFKPGRSYQEVARNRLERLRSTPVFAGDRIYVRGLEHVYCLGRAPATASR